jgi:hypothetical protein
MSMVQSPEPRYGVAALGRHRDRHGQGPVNLSRCDSSRARRAAPSSAGSRRTRRRRRESFLGTPVRDGYVEPSKQSGSLRASSNACTFEGASDLTPGTSRSSPGVVEIFRRHNEAWRTGQCRPSKFHQPPRGLCRAAEPGGHVKSRFCQPICGAAALGSLRHTRPQRFPLHGLELPTVYLLGN